MIALKVKELKLLHRSPVAPKIVPFSFGDESVMAGSAAQVTCLASDGDLPMDIQWYFRGSNVSSLGMSTAKVGSRTSLLVIDSVTPHNGGLYTCRASNPAGVTEYSAELLVQGTLVNSAPILALLRDRSAVVNQDRDQRAEVIGWV